MIRTGKKLSVELEITLNDAAYFPSEVRDRVDKLGWADGDSPRDSDYLLELILWLMDTYRDIGIHIDSASIGIRQTNNKGEIQ